MTAPLPTLYDLKARGQTLTGVSPENWTMWSRDEGSPSQLALKKSQIGALSSKRGCAVSSTLSETGRGRGA